MDLTYYQKDLPEALTVAIDTTGERAYEEIHHTDQKKPDRRGPFDGGNETGRRN